MYYSNPEEDGEFAYVFASVSVWMLLDEERHCSFPLADGRVVSVIDWDLSIW